ncbi:hypothetical protein D9M68_742200 [compost metagenome]
MPNHLLNQRVLYASLSQIVDEGVSEAVKGLPWVVDPELGFVTAEPLRRGMAILSSCRLQIGEQPEVASNSESFDVFQQSEIQQL